MKKRVIIRFEKEFKEKVLEEINNNHFEYDIIKERKSYYIIEVNEEDILLLKNLKLFVESIDFLKKK